VDTIESVVSYVLNVVFQTSKFPIRKIFAKIV